MYTKIASVMLLSGFFCLSACKSSSADPETGEAYGDKDPGKIQVALLLDTSSSMDGLIEQAKSYLWNVTNTLTTLRYNGKTPVIEIALYEYGNDGLSPEQNYIRRITPLTTDLDLISEKLFELKTYGGEEYCGAVIGDAVDKLDWGGGNSDMKLLYIAGNEEFFQGGVPFAKAIAAAREKDIYVNTIFCGNREEGIRTSWKTGADKGLGKFFTIEQDAAISYIETPYDDDLARYNERLNDTYIGYGSQGSAKKSNQAAQDFNANAVSYAVASDRIVSKSKSVYKNDSWDLVDKVKEDKQALKKIRKDELPAELKSKSPEEVEQYVAQKSAEREKINKEIDRIAKKRQAFIDKKSQESPDKDNLGKAMRQSIVELAESKGYTVAR